MIRIKSGLVERNTDRPKRVSIVDKMKFMKINDPPVSEEDLEEGELIINEESECIFEAEPNLSEHDVSSDLS